MYFHCKYVLSVGFFLRNAKSKLYHFYVFINGYQKRFSTNFKLISFLFIVRVYRLTLYRTHIFLIRQNTIVFDGVCIHAISMHVLFFPPPFLSSLNSTFPSMLFIKSFTTCINRCIILL